MRRVFFLQDRAVTNGMPKTFGVLRCAADGDFPDPERLETKAAKPQVLFSQNGIVLSVLYPNLMQNLDAQGAGIPNQTSAVLLLSCAERRVVFSGDATIEAWDWLTVRFAENKPLACDIMTIPHHGGAISRSEATEAVSQHHLYTDLIRPTYGVVSVATVNPHDHPNIVTIKALRDAGVTVLCTQMTSKCSNDLEAIRSSRGTIPAPSRSVEEPDYTGSHRSRHVACFGSVVAEISKSELRIRNLKRHQQNMLTFSALGYFGPLCSPAGEA